MARQAELEGTLPTTLPDDFNHWDTGDAPPATLPNDFDNFDDAPAPRVRSSAPQAVVAAPAPGKVAEKPVHRLSVVPPMRTMPAPPDTPPPAPKRTQEFPRMRGSAVEPQPAGGANLTIHEVTTPPPAKYVSTQELSILVQEYNAKLDEGFDGEMQRRKNLMIRWIGAIVLFLAMGSAMFFLKLHKPASQSQGVVVVQHPLVTYTPDATPLKEKPSPAKPEQPATETTAPSPQP